MRNPSFGTVAFAAIFVISYLMVTFSVSDAVSILILAILGAAVGIFNITKKEEINFLVAITSLNVIIAVWSLVLDMPSMLQSFLTYLSISFGVAGLMIALAVIIRLGWNR